jgi:hypothetical protein
MPSGFAAGSYDASMTDSVARATRVPSGSMMGCEPSRKRRISPGAT